MTPERWKKLDALFHEALELQGEARATHLAKVCGDDEQLRAEVEKLIAAHERESSFIDSPIFAEAVELTDDDRNRSPIGHSIGPYMIVSQLGRGGMGEVFLAEDVRLERKVALKVLPAAFTQNPDRVQRFEREAKAASALNHPNILTIHEIGEASTEDGGAHYIVSEFVEGETLRALMQRGRLGLNEATAIADQVAGALSVAHGAGIIHRDIKPENVMVRPDGLVKVLDFGLAKLTGMRNAEWGMGNEEAEMLAQTPRDIPHSAFRIPHSTAPGMVMGTVSYMSPEQARGLRVDHRTDIFSLGVMLYEMIAGRRPFEGATTSDVIAALLTAEPPPLSQHCAEAPAELERTTEKCLAKDREARHQSAKELIAELKTLRTGSQTEEAPVRRRIEGVRARLASRRRLLRIPIAVIAALLVVGLVWFLSWRRAPAVQPDQIKSLAVLPLENLSGDPAQEYFADGMTDALIGDLAKIGALRVISRTSAMHYKGTKKSLPQIATELGVDAVVEGTVLRSGNRVLIRARLIHVATERHLWVETYERDLRNVLVLQSEVAYAIAREVRTKTTPTERARLASGRLVNRKAFDDYLQGRYLYWNKRTEEGLRKAIEYFQSAIKEDPAYAPAYMGMADCYNQLGSVNISSLPSTEAMQRTEEAARRAIGLDGNLAEAHVSLAFIKQRQWKWAESEQEYQLAIRLNPNDSSAHNYYSGYLSARGQTEEAIAEANRAQELNPLSLAISTQRGFVLNNARRYDEAVAQLRRVLEVGPNHYQAHWFLAIAYAYKRQFDEAIEATALRPSVR